MYGATVGVRFALHSGIVGIVSFVLGLVWLSCLSLTLLSWPLTLFLWCFLPLVMSATRWAKRNRTKSHVVFLRQMAIFARELSCNGAYFYHVLYSRPGVDGMARETFLVVFVDILIHV